MISLLIIPALLAELTLGLKFLRDPACFAHTLSPILFAVCILYLWLWSQKNANPIRAVTGKHLTKFVRFQHLVGLATFAVCVGFAIGDWP